MQSSLKKQPKTMRAITGGNKSYDFVFVKDPLYRGTSYWLVLENELVKDRNNSVGNGLVFCAIEIYIIGREEILYTDMDGKNHAIPDIRLVSSFEAMTEYGTYGYCLNASSWTMQRKNIASSAKAPAAADFIKSSDFADYTAERMQIKEKSSAPDLCFSRDKLMLYEYKEGRASYPVEIEAII